MAAENMYQSVYLTFNDGSEVCFTGKAAVSPCDPNKQRILRVRFTEPKPLPEGYKFGGVEGPE